MKQSDFVKIEKQLIDLLPEYSIKGSLLYTITRHKMLAGISFEGSSFNKETFFANYFVMPLARPTQHIYFNYGDRLRDGRGTDGWSINKEDLVEELREAIKNQVIPWVSTFESTKEAVRLIKHVASESRNFRIWETGAVMLASYGDTEGAILFSDRCLKACDISIPWHREIVEYLEKLKKACLASPPSLESLLDSWVQNNLLTLKLSS